MPYIYLYFLGSIIYNRLGLCLKSGNPADYYNERESMSRKKTDNKKSERKELFISLLIVAFIIFLAVVLALSARNKKKSSSGTDDSVYEEDYSKYKTSAEKYSAGLTEDGKISGINDINDYVKLPEKFSSYILYTGDYPMADEAGIAAAGSYLIDKITEDSEVKAFEEYRKALENLLKFSAESWYEEYVEAHKNTDESEKYTSFEDFMKYSQNMDMETYENHIRLTSEKEMKRYMVIQALVEKLGITYDEEDIKETAVVSANSNNTEKIFARFGMPYMKQRTAEYKLEAKLVEDAEKKEGSVKDGWKDDSLIYGAGLYDNGRISGIGDISNYVTKYYDPSVIDSVPKDAESVLEIILKGSEIKLYDEYTEKLKALFAYTEGGNPSDYQERAEKECRYRILIQYMLDKYELSPDLVKVEYFEGMSSDERAEFEYTHGNAYINRQLMEYAVRKFLSK